VLRRLPAYAKQEFRQELSAAGAEHARLGPASLVLYGVSTLYFETDTGDGFREPGFSNYAEVPVRPHQRWPIEKSFRMSKHDLQARPVCHHLRESIEAHLTIVFAALAVGRWIEHQTGWSIRKFAKTARRYRIIQIQAGKHVITAADPLPRRPPDGPQPNPRPGSNALNCHKSGNQLLSFVLQSLLKMDVRHPVCKQVQCVHKPFG
jgi:hypothetical protein